MENRKKESEGDMSKRRGNYIEGKTSLRHATNVIAVVVDERFMIKMRSRREIELARIPKLS